ncbi:MAG: hypothetical protein EOP11_25680 [Proteobacteria bacterium]|nr:MAG: hypothetical protein EOP11_25680 [Pseudomonadota bacterium]
MQSTLLFLTILLLGSPAAHAGLARYTPPSVGDLEVAATGSLRDLQLDLGDMGRSGACVEKQPGLLALAKQTSGKDIPAWTKTIQRDRNEIDGLVSQLEKTDTSAGSPQSRDCEQSIAELRGMYFRIQSTYKTVGNNTTIVLDRYNEMGEKFEKEFARMKVDPKDPSCQKLSEGRKKFAKQYNESKKTISDLAKFYNARAAETARSIAGVPSGYCKTGDAATQTITRSNVDTDTRTMVNESVNTITKSNQETKTTTNINTEAAPTSKCRGLTRCD